MLVLRVDFIYPFREHCNVLPVMLFFICYDAIVLPSESLLFFLSVCLCCSCSWCSLSFNLIIMIYSIIFLVLLFYVFRVHLSSYWA
jgi:hypothetical protein